MMKNIFISFFGFAACMLFSNDVEGMNDLDFADGFGKELGFSANASLVNKNRNYDKQDEINYNRAQGWIAYYGQVFGDENKSTSDLLSTAVQRLFQINRLWYEVSQDRRDQFAIEAEWLITKFYPKAKDMFCHPIDIENKLKERDWDSDKLIADLKSEIKMINQEQADLEEIAVNFIAALVTFNQAVSDMIKLKSYSESIDKEFQKISNLKDGKEWLVSEIENSNDNGIYYLAQKQCLYSIIYLEVCKELNNEHFMRRSSIVKNEVTLLKNKETCADCLPTSMRLSVLKNLLAKYTECGNNISCGLNYVRVNTAIQTFKNNIWRMKINGISENTYSNPGIYLQLTMRMYNIYLLSRFWLDRLIENMKNMSPSMRFIWRDNEVKRLESQRESEEKDSHLIEVDTAYGKILCMRKDDFNAHLMALKTVIATPRP